MWYLCALVMAGYKVELTYHRQYVMVVTKAKFTLVLKSQDDIEPLAKQAYDAVFR